MYAQNVAQRRIEIGWATPIARLEAAKAAGFDYVEVNASDIAGLSEEAFNEALMTQKRLDPTPVAECFRFRGMEVFQFLAERGSDDADGVCRATVWEFGLPNSAWYARVWRG